MLSEFAQNRPGSPGATVSHPAIQAGEHGVASCHALGSHGFQLDGLDGSVRQSRTEQSRPVSRVLWDLGAGLLHMVDL